MLNIYPGRRDVFTALAGRAGPSFGDQEAPTALTLCLQAGGGRPHVEVLP